MEYALTADHHHVHAFDAEKGQEYYCPVCGNQVIPRQGEVNSWHFAHVTSCMDDWKYDMSEWHRGWQSRFPENVREIVVEHRGECHRADILMGGYVIEFQHSPISAGEFELRNKFYTRADYKVIWVFDETYAFGNEYISSSLDDENKFVWKWPNRALASVVPQRSTDKESCNDVLTEEGDAFVPKEVSKKIKELKKDRSPESVALRTLLEKVESLVKSEKEIKAEIKAKSAALQAKTKDTIERLSDEQALDLLEKKWIAPLIESIHKLPDTVIDSLVSKIQALQNKYATTFFEVEQQISETEATLSGMIDDLEGNEYDMLGLNELKKLLGGSAE